MIYLNYIVLMYLKFNSLIIKDFKKEILKINFEEDYFEKKSYSSINSIQLIKLLSGISFL